MLNLIPRFIHARFKDNERCGRFDAAAVFVDIAGFTALTGAFMRQGKEGAELISDIINRIYTPTINEIYRSGGFISTFAGDGFTALFAGETAEYAIDTVLTIQDSFASGKHRATDGKIDSDLNVRIGVSFGAVEWGIVGSAPKAFYFKGPPIVECARAIENIEPGDIAVRGYNARTGAGGTLRMFIKRPSATTGISSGRIGSRILREFVPDRLMDSDITGEFRDVATVFTAFRNNEDFGDINGFISSAFATAGLLGGYTNGLFFGDKDPHALVLFGAPISYENNAKRAIDFALRLRDEFGDNVKSGITDGTAYTGIIGSRRRCTYTAIGNTVNLSARLMGAALWGKILLPENLAERIDTDYVTGDFKRLSLKGIPEPVLTFEVLSPAERNGASLFSGETVGRERELSRLEGLCNPIFDGEPGGAVYVYGEAGIGKSRLIYDLKRRATEAKTFILQTDSILRKSMNPFIHEFKDYFGQSDNATENENETAFREKLGKLIARLREIHGDETARERADELERQESMLKALVGLSWEGTLYEELDAESRFTNTLFAIKELFKAESLLRPIIIVLEDLHWLDDDSRRVFSTLTRNLEGFPIVVIATSRLNDDGTKPVLDLDEEVKTSAVELQRFSADDARSFMALQFDSPVEDRLAAFVLDRAGGNPFYIEQLCRYLTENRFAEIADGRYRLAKEELEIPTGIRAILIARIDRLSRRLKELAYTASVLGREFEVEILSRMVRSLESETEEANLTALLVEGETNAVWSEITELLYIFKHALLRDAVYDMQLRKNLRELHNTAARALLDFYGRDETRYADIAFHFEKAEVREKTVEFLRKAADYAKKEYKNEQYLAHLKRLLAYAGDEREEAQINFEIAETLMHIGEWEDATALFEANVKTAEALNDRRSLASNLNKLGRMYLNSGKRDRAHDAYERALKVFEDAGDLRGQSDSLYCLGEEAVHRGEYEEGLQLSQWSRQAAERAGDTGIVAKATQLMGKIYTRQENLAMGTECYREFLKISRERGDRHDICMGLSLLGLNTDAAGDSDQALKLYDEAIEIARDIGAKKELARSYNNKAIIFEKRGDYEEALRFYTACYDISREMGDMVTGAISLMNAANINGKLGNADEALDMLNRVLAVEGGIDEQNRSFAIAIIGVMYNSKGEFDLAVKYFREAEDIAWGLDIPPLAAMFIGAKIPVLIEMGKFDEASTNIEKALPILRDSGIEDTAALVAVYDSEVTAHRDRDAGIEKMLGLIDDFDGAPELAEAYYRLYRITGEEAHRREAIKYRKELIEQLPEHNNKKVLEFLERDR